MSDAADRKLVVELAVAISLFLQEALAYEADDAGFLHHSYQGPFDEGSFILWELGAASADVAFADWNREAGPDQLAPAGFKFFAADRTRDIVQSHSAFAPTLVDRLIGAYLRSMIRYRWQGAQLDAGRDVFEPAVIFVPQIDALIECGYMIRDGTAVAWTDKIAPAMQDAYIWDETSAPPVHPPVRLDANTHARVEALIRADRRIDAIKAIRDATRVGLLQAKLHMEAMVEELLRK